MLDAKNTVHNLRISGVTLTELMITLAIAAMVTTMAIPTFSITIARSRITSNTNEFLSYLNYARNEAITRGRRVIVCKSADATSCADTGSWEQGFVVFVDTNNNNEVDADANEILRVHTKFDSTVTITGSNLIKKYIAYSSDGRTRIDSGFSQSGTLNVCYNAKSDNNSNRDLRSAIVISKVGRARAVKSCNQCPSSCTCSESCG